MVQSLGLGAALVNCSVMDRAKKMWVRRYKCRRKKKQVWPWWRRLLSENDRNGHYLHIFGEQVPALAVSGTPHRRQQVVPRAVVPAPSAQMLQFSDEDSPGTACEDQSRIIGQEDATKPPPAAAEHPDTTRDESTEEGPHNIADDVNEREFEEEPPPSYQALQAGEMPVTLAEDLLEGVGKRFMAAKVRHAVSDAAAASLWQVMLQCAQPLAHCVAAGVSCTYQTVRNKFRVQLPPIRMDVMLEECAITGEEGAGGPWTRRSLLALESFPSNLVHQPEEGVRRRVLFVRTYVDVAAIKSLHAELHPDRDVNDEVQMSIDGVALSNSSGRSMEVISLRFRKCGIVYPISILLPEKGYKPTKEEILSDFIQSMLRSGLKVRTCIADSPMRSLVIGIKLHSGYYSCPFCVAKGTRTKHLRAVVYPPSTRFAAARSREGCSIIRRDHAELTDTERQGLKAVYPLHPLGLDWLDCIPPEYMHSAIMGVVRRLFTLTFQVPTARSSPESKVRRVPSKAINNMWLRVRLPSELQRRTRLVDYASFKACEFKILVVYCLPAVLQAIPSTGETWRMVRRCWCLLVAALRAMLLPDSEYKAFDRDYPGRITAWVDRFYVTFAQVFGRSSCSPNIHSFIHLKHFRDKCGPLPENSAFPYEASYGRLRRFYAAGGESPALQALRGAYQRTIAGHHCSRQLVFRTGSTRKRCDSLVYLADGSIWEIEQVKECEQMVVGRRWQVNGNIAFGRGIEWHRLGVHGRGELTETTRTFPYAACQGKVLSVGPYFVKIARDSLQE